MILFLPLQIQTCAGTGSIPDLDGVNLDRAPSLPQRTEPAKAPHVASYNTIAAELAMPGPDQPPICDTIDGQTSLLPEESDAQDRPGAGDTEGLVVLPGRPIS